MAITKDVAAALLEFEHLGRFSDETREALQAAAGEVEPDDQADDDEKADEKPAASSSGKAARAGGSK